jgi:hypothetical protein
MRLGKCVLATEADSLLGYTDGILRDLKDAEMAMREINSTWHDTARGGLPPGTSRAPTESNPPGALATLLGSSCDTPVTAYIGSSSDVSDGARAGRALPFRDSARVCFNYHLYYAVCVLSG